jgi:hypothetical protein
VATRVAARTVEAALLVQLRRLPMQLLRRLHGRVHGVEARSEQRHAANRSRSLGSA